MTDRSSLAAVLDLVADIDATMTRVGAAFDPAAAYRSEIESQAVARIRRQAAAVGDRAWERATQATDLLIVNRSERGGLSADPDPAARWRRFWAARDGYCLDFLDGVAGTLAELVAHLEALEGEARELIAAMSAIEPRAVPREDVPGIAAALVAEWRGVLEVAREVAEVRFERGVAALLAATTLEELREALRVNYLPEHDGLAAFRAAELGQQVAA